MLVAEREAPPPAPYLGTDAPAASCCRVAPPLDDGLPASVYELFDIGDDDHANPDQERGELSTLAACCRTPADVDDDGHSDRGGLGDGASTRYRQLGKRGEARLGDIWHSRRESDQAGLVPVAARVLGSASMCVAASMDSLDLDASSRSSAALRHARVAPRAKVAMVAMFLLCLFVVMHSQFTNAKSTVLQKDVRGSASKI